ncbi:hypothetical protein MLD38_035601 [Melastoma candidum]|uniref:Uncharacterized protein n=1 Tax=Melastoma candidum TaxID=119954 RepID=A0ACB9LGK5_9MYRT|nr:hypothetical protein MLD38_035601 [Melastoma candidum]
MRKGSNSVGPFAVERDSSSFLRPPIEFPFSNLISFWKVLDFFNFSNCFRSRFEGDLLSGGFLVGLSNGDGDMRDLL